MQTGSFRLRVGGPNGSLEPSSVRVRVPTSSWGDASVGRGSDGIFGMTAQSAARVMLLVLERRGGWFGQSLLLVDRKRWM
jgi:hypothetical protein